MNKRNTFKIITPQKKHLLSFFCLMLAVTLTFNLSGQFFEDVEDDWTDQQHLRGEQKSATRAIIYSSIFPGGGHLYVNPSSLGTYLFPLLEVGFWAGYFYFNSQGSQIEDDYMDYADKHYNRDYFHIASNNLMNQDNASNIYNEEHFRLDEDNTQHYYEDIGKYNKYIFGWTDWYEKYVHSETQDIRWAFDDDGLWLGNVPIDADEDASYDRPYSSLRAKYIEMRRDAQENYDLSYLMTFGFAFNRIISSLDAVRVTNRYNRELRYSYDFNIKIQPDYANNTVTPMLNFVMSY